MIKWRVDSGTWIALHRSVFCIAGSKPSWKRSMLAGVLAFGDDVFASHESAAALHSLPGFPPGSIHITVPRGRRRKARGIVAHQAELVPTFDRAIVDAIPVTSTARTLIDIAMLSGIDVVEEATDYAINRGLVSLKGLTWELDQLSNANRPGTGLLRKIVEVRTPGDRSPESRLERKFLRLIKKAGLRLPVAQLEICDRTRRFVARVDFAYPDLMLAIELDGYAYHGSRPAFQRDRERTNSLVALGWRVIRFTWEDIELRPKQVASRLRGLLS